MKNKPILPIFTIAALAAMAFTSCTSEDSFQEDVNIVNPSNTKGAAISFGSYLSRSAQTRGKAVLEPADVAINGGIGLFAMYTNGKIYDSTAKPDSAVTSFTDNFMQNINLRSSLSKEDLNNGKGDVAGSWSYAPLRYWPITPDEHISFMAYSPYNAENTTLYNKNGETEGDRTYIKHTVAADQRNHTDLMYADASNIANMQLYKNQDGTWTKKGDFSESTDNSSTPKVNLKLKHATSRIAFAVTSSALKDPNNFLFTGQDGNVYRFGDIEKGMAIDLVTSASSQTYITVNKVIFLGDNSSAETTPKGTFYSNGFLNLSKTLDDKADEANNKPLWVVPGDVKKQAFTFDNTLKTKKGEDSIRTCNGYYDGTSQGTVSLKNGGESEQLLWYPIDTLYSESLGDTEIGSYIYASWSYTESWWRRLLRMEVNEKGDTVGTNNGNFYARMFGIQTPLTPTIVNNFVNKTLRNAWEVNWKKYMQGNTIRATWEPVDEGKPVTDGFSVNAIGNRADDYMFVIPQDFSAGKDDLWVYLDYTVNYDDGVSGEVKEKGINYKVYKKVEKKFEPGKSYVIVMDIGNNNKFNSINFSVQTDNWIDEEKADVQF